MAQGSKNIYCNAEQMLSLPEEIKGRDVVKLYQIFDNIKGNLDMNEVLVLSVQIRHYVELLQETYQSQSFLDTNPFFKKVIHKW